MLETNQEKGVKTAVEGEGELVAVPTNATNTRDTVGFSKGMWARGKTSVPSR